MAGCLRRGDWLYRYALFLKDHIDEDEHELRSALNVLTAGTKRLRDALDAYHRAVTEWREQLAEEATS
jgi:hypothetical protein